MISNKGLSLAQMNAAFPTSQISNGLLHIALFKGTAPKISKALDLMPHGGVGSVLNWASVVSNLGLLQTNYLGDMACPPMTPIVNAAARTVTLPLGGLSSTLIGEADGAPTFYVARSITSNTVASWAGFTYNAAIAGPFWIGTVGAQGSDAELQFIGGTIKTGQAYRFLDLTIQL